MLEKCWYTEKKQEVFMFTVLGKAVVIAFFTALGVYVSIIFHLAPWIIFIGWLSYVLNEAKLRNIPSSLMQNALGILTALVLTYSVAQLAGKLGFANAFAVSAFICITLVMLISGTVKFLGNAILIFLGLICYFSYIFEVFNPVKALLMFIPLLIGYGIGVVSTWVETFVDYLCSSKKEIL
jgi:hypothetical protein